MRHEDLEDHAKHETKGVRLKAILRSTVVAFRQHVDPMGKYPKIQILLGASEGPRSSQGIDSADTHG